MLRRCGSNLESLRIQKSAHKKQAEFTNKSLQGFREGLNSGVYTVVQVLDAEEKYREAQLAFNKACQDEQSTIFQMLSLIGKLNHDTLGISTAHK